MKRSKRITEYNRPTAFTCYAREDRGAAVKIYQYLLRNNSSPWMDIKDLLPGQDWEMEIRRVIRRVDVVVVCLSPTSVRKIGFAQKEMRFALDAADERPEGTIYIVPVKLEACSIPEHLRKWHCVTLEDSNGYSRLLQAVRSSGHEPREDTAEGMSAPRDAATSIERRAETMRSRLADEVEELLVRIDPPRVCDQIGVEQLAIFSLGEIPVTQELYQAVAGTNPSLFPSVGHPVENVSWYDAVQFCNLLSSLCGLEPAYNFIAERVELNTDSRGLRLPTESEWECACGGLTRVTASSLGAVAWYVKNSANRTMPVGRKAPSPLGLYDMLGNVWEWCWDAGQDQRSSHLRSSTEVDARVIRGGSWNCSPRNVSAQARQLESPSYKNYNIGFRLACNGVFC